MCWKNVHLVWQLNHVDYCRFLWWMIDLRRNEEVLSLILWINKKHDANDHSNLERTCSSYILFHFSLQLTNQQVLQYYNNDVKYLMTILEGIIIQRGAFYVIAWRQIFKTRKRITKSINSVNWSLTTYGIRQNKICVADYRYYEKLSGH